MAKTGFASSPAKIKVIGVGGGGCNAVTRMVRSEIRGVEFVVMNTDAQCLALAEAGYRLQIGERLTKGLGVGGDPSRGQKSAEESVDEIKEIVSGADMVFVTAGMGGGTGTGAAPTVAQMAKQAGALTIAVVTKPFSFEGRHRMRNAEEGIARFVDKVDTLIIIPNDKVLTMCDPKTTVEQAFQMADDVLRHGVQAISEVITVPGLINLDFADIKAIMQDAGPAWMSIGKGTGQNRALDAAKQALASPLLDVSVQGARGVLFNVVGGDSLTLMEVNGAANVIKQAVAPDANIIFGVAHDSTLDNEVRITLVATGFQTDMTLGGGSRGHELAESVKATFKEDEDLDIPSFLRRPLFGSRRKLPDQQTVKAPQVKTPAS